MAYRFQRDTARDRARSVVGDTADPPLLRGGEGAYDAIIAAAPSEHMAARIAARDLAAQLSKDPDKLGGGGNSLAWTERISYLLSVWNGTVGTGLAGDPGLTTTTGPTATGAKFRGKPRPDYTLAGGDIPTSSQ